MLLLKVWYRFTGLLLKLFYKVLFGKHMTWGKGFHLRRGFQTTVENGGYIVLGDNVFFNNGCALHARKRIVVGDETIFGENVRIYDHNHRFADPSHPIKEQGYSEAPITIGRHCWIGSNVTILKGSNIGDNSVVGAGCVINGDIPANSVVRANTGLSITPIIPKNTYATIAPVNKTNTNVSQNGPERVLVLDTVMDRGGAETMMMNYLRHMDRTKVTYDFLVNRDYKAAYEDEIEQLGGRIYRMCPMYPQYFGRYKKEFREFLQHHPEYHIIHSNLEERSYFGLRVAKEMGVPVRIAHSHNRPVGFDLKSVFREYFRMRLPKYTTHMFACGEEAGDWLFGKKNRSRVIQQRNAIDTALYRYDADIAAAVRTEFGVTDSNTLVVGHVGRFFPQKNHDFLIDIFNALHKQQPNSVLWLVGGGELNDELKNQIREKVDRLGLHDAVHFFGVRSDVNRIMQGMDCFLLPSLYEGFPVTMIEAQACGLPCVISDRVPAQCDVTGTVCVVSLRDTPDQWAAAVLQHMQKLVSRDRTQGVDTVTQAGFDITANAQWLQDFYLETLAKKK